ncbi:hypothetical protein DL98DRAFT_48085 [Cadophora sp. DSE1049]|nr:hypothetical protein DL98DRAFT_48085 [Cadophora sp. DSE1049]
MMLMFLVDINKVCSIYKRPDPPPFSVPLFSPASKRGTKKGGQVSSKLLNEMRAYPSKQTKHTDMKDYLAAGNDWGFWSFDFSGVQRLLVEKILAILTGLLVLVLCYYQALPESLNSTRHPSINQSDRQLERIASMARQDSISTFLGFVLQQAQSSLGVAAGSLDFQ